jgi:hypothetical protein
MGLQKSNPRRLAVRLSTVLFITACASPGGVQVRVNQLTALEKYDEAAALVEKEKFANYGEKNALLYDLDRGMLLHLAGKYADSNEAFEKAKALSKTLYTKSVTTEAGTFLVSDNLRPYVGESFERAMVSLFCALNYLLLEQGMDALVETRQVDAYLTKLKTDQGQKNTYVEDAFARYLAGLIQEDQGEVNDAFISYYQALGAYDTYKKNYGLEAPRELVRDALRTAQKLGFSDRVAEIKKRWGDASAAPWPKGAGEVVVLHYQGLPPRKVDTFFEISVVKGLVFVDAQRPVGQEAQQVEEARTVLRSAVSDQMIRIAFPSFEPAPYEIRGMTVRSEGSDEHAADPAQDIGAIAAKDLKDRIGRERAKAIARAVIKWSLTQKASKKAKEKWGEGAAFLLKAGMQVMASATEMSDKRSWGTLPDRINVARLVLPEGEHDVHVAFRTAAGSLVSSKDVEHVKVRAGHKTFIFVRTAQ